MAKVAYQLGADAGAEGKVLIAREYFPAAPLPPADSLPLFMPASAFALPLSAAERAREMGTGGGGIVNLSAMADGMEWCGAGGRAALTRAGPDLGRCATPLAPPVSRRALSGDAVARGLRGDSGKLMLSAVGPPAPLGLGVGPPAFSTAQSTLGRSQSGGPLREGLSAAGARSSVVRTSYDAGRLLWNF